MKRVICLVVCLMVLIIPAVIAAEAVSIDGVVYDRIDLFTESEVKSLNDEAEKHFGSLRCKIYIVTAQMPDYIGEDFTAEYDVSSNSIVLIIADNSKRNYNMYTYGDADWRITNPEVDAILDAADVYDNIKMGKYFEGALAFIGYAAQGYSGEGVSTAVEKIDYTQAVVIGIFGGLAISLCTGLGIIIFYKRKLRSVTYPLEKYARMDLTYRNENFMGSFVTKRVIQSSSSGGGKSGGGGGGGHRGGR